MTGLLIAALLITAATIWLLARPLRASGVQATEDREALVQLRDRLIAQLRELAVEAGDRNMDATVAAEERQRLEAELAAVLKDLDRAPGAVAGMPTAAPQRRLWLATVIVLAIALPLVSAGFYLGKNGPVLAAVSELQSSVVTADGQRVPPMVLQMVKRLEKRLAEQPNDAKGWARLGRAYEVLGRQAEAEQAFARAYKLAPKDEDVLLAYASFYFARDPTNPSPQAIELFVKLNALNPKDPTTLWALGLAAYNDKKFSQALKYWEPLLAMLPPQHEATQQVRRAVEAARTQGKAG
ncbi:MAG: tetratricopeptide repeat protein [Sulfurifustaceae bacterium]